MRHKPGMLPGISFHIIFTTKTILFANGFYHGNKLLKPGTSGMFWTHIPAFLVEYISVCLRTFHEIFVVFPLSECLGHLCYTPVIIGIFKRVGNRSLICRNESFFHIRFKVSIPNIASTFMSLRHSHLHFFHCCIGLFHIKITDTFLPGIYDEWYFMRSHHDRGIFNPSWTFR